MTLPINSASVRPVGVHVPLPAQRAEESAGSNSDGRAYTSRRDHTGGEGSLSSQLSPPFHPRGYTIADGEVHLPRTDPTRRSRPVIRSFSPWSVRKEVLWS